MRRLVCWVVLAGLAVLPLTASASTQVYLGFKIGTVNAPPPPPIVFQSLPATVVVPGSSVYVVNDPKVDYDVFRYNVYWYTCRDGYWYRCRSHRGPFTVVDARNVPREVLTVPANHWHHYPLAEAESHRGGESHGHGKKKGQVVVETEPEHQHHSYH
jgi:hypothetical protein